MTKTPKQPKAEGTTRLPLDARIAESKFVRETEEREVEMRNADKLPKPPLGPFLKSPD